MTTPSVSWTLSDDRMTLRIVRSTPEGERHTTVGWGHPCTERELAAALREPNLTIAAGQRYQTRRWVRGRWAFFAHRMSGPPTWWLPRVTWKDRSLVVGWLRLGYAFAVRQTPPSEATS